VVRSGEVMFGVVKNEGGVMNPAFAFLYTIAFSIIKLYICRNYIIYVGSKWLDNPK
jgi:hypothetical protein